MPHERTFICQGTSSTKTAKGPFRSLSQAAICCYLSNQLKVKAIPLNAFLAQGHNKRTYRIIFTLTLLNAERQTGKL